MTLVRYRPSRDTFTFQDEVSQMIENFLKPAPVAAAGGSWIPAIDVRETEADYLVRAELPGVKKDDIKLNLVNNTLTIQGAKKQETVEKQGTWQHLERVYGTFERTLKLPTAVQPDKISARFTDGVLEISVPKAETARPREIKIEL